MTAKDWKDLVASGPCVLCQHLGAKQVKRTACHHPREGQGLSQRADDAICVALCDDCHQGPNGFHGLGTRRFYQVYRLDIFDLIAMTTREAWKRL